MAIYKVTYQRLVYKNRRLHKKIKLGSVLIGELNYSKHFNHLDRLGMKKGIQIGLQGDEMLSVTTEEFTVKQCINWRTVKPFVKTGWETVSAESF